jgi:hypothetical protein
MQMMSIYRGVEIHRNFTSINGTGAQLKSQRGWNLRLQGYGRLGWSRSTADAKQYIDSLYEDCSPPIARALGIPTWES